MIEPGDYAHPHAAIDHDDDGDQDIWAGLPIKRLILETDTFIVFIDTEGEIDWRTVGYDWSKVDLGKFDAIINRAAALETIRRDGIDADFTDNHKRLVAEAIARALDGDLAAAQAMLNLAEEILNAKSREAGRLWYLAACFMTVVPFALMVLVLWILRQIALPHLGETLFWMLLGSASGAAGALLSILIRNSEISCELSSGKILYFAEAASRILAGAIAGGLAALAVKAGWLFEPLVKAHQGNPTIIIAAFAAGYIERFTTSLIANIAPSVAKLQTTADSPAPQPLTSDKPRRGKA